MPTYCYRDGDDIYEVRYPFGEAPEEIEIRRGTLLIQAVRDRQAEFVTQSISIKGGSGHVRRTWPQRCYASGVHADQGQELAKHLKDRGCPTEVVGGDPIYTSAAHKRKALKIRGFVDKNSFN